MRRADSNTLKRMNAASGKSLARPHLLLAALAVFLCGTAASAQTNIYQLRGSTDYGIYTYNVPANTLTTVYKPYPVNPGSTNSATIAQRPSDGMLFYVMYTGSPGNNPIMFQFNPATPNVAPVQVGTGLGGTVPSSLRMAFSPTGTLYYLPDTRLLYTINTTTGVATSTGVTIGSSTQITSGGDMAFSSTGTLYICTSSKTLWTASITTGTATQIGDEPIVFSPSANATIGLAFNAAGDLLAQTQNPNNIYRIPLPVASNAAPTGVLVRAGDGSTTSTGDMASANVPQPNLSITKNDGVTTVYRGGPVTYTIVVTNSSAYPVTGTVTDTVPASVTGVTWNCVASAGSACTTASGSGNAINTSATLLVGGTATYTVSGTIAAGASGSLVNTATVAVPSWLTDSSPANNTATDTDTINLNANLGITKTDGLATINPGSAVTYTIVVSNAGPDASTGSIVTDTVPASITGVTWTCGAATGGATCGAASGSGNAISTTANLPSGSSVTYTVSGTLSLTATGTLTNTATVLTPASGVSDPTDLGRTGAGNNSATDNTTIVPIVDVRIAKSHSGNFTVGVNGSYTLTASNSGSLPTSGTITVIDNLPAGLTVAAIPTPVGWNCSTTIVGSSTMTCTSSTVIPAGANHPNTITLSVVVAPAAFPSVTNAATISGGGELAAQNGNNSANDPTTVNGVSDVRIAKSHSGNFTVGVNGSYTLTASNSGTLATSGTITVIDNLPAGLTVAAIPTPVGWNCSTTVVGSSTMTCTSSTVIPAGANHPNTITLSVVVAAAAFPSVTNAATISGGGEPAYNNGNNTVTDPTTVNGVSDVRIAKSHSGNFTVGVNGSYTLTASNSGTLATSGTITVIDNLPAGLTVAAIPVIPNWNCGTTVVGSSTMTCTSSTVIPAGANHPNTIILSVVVAPAAFPSVTNAATISGGGEPAYNNGNNTVTDPTTVNGVSDVRIAKSHSGNFTVGVNGSYTLTASNSGTLATSGTITVIDNLPAGLTVAAIPVIPNWNCGTTVVGSSTMTCTSATVIAAGGTHPNTITLSVVVAPAAFPSVTNSATISGGGEPAYNNGNNTVTDPTTVNGIPDLTITKTHTGNFTQGQTGATYSITVTNSGTAATVGTVTVVDTLPSGLTATAINGSGWSCVLGTLTCTRSDALAPGLSYPAITLTVDVSLTAPASVTNTATVSGGGENNAANNTANDPTTIIAAAPPNISLVKSVSPPGTQLPGTDLLYTIVYTNTGGQPANNLVIVDPNPANAIPAERVFRNVDFKIGTLTSSPGSTGLVATFQYSNDGGTTWTYVPVSGAGGAPAGYDRVVTNVRWSFTGSLSQTAPNNSGSVSLTVRIR